MISDSVGQFGMRKCHLATFNDPDLSMSSADDFTLECHFITVRPIVFVRIWTGCISIGVIGVSIREAPDTDGWSTFYSCTKNGVESKRSGGFEMGNEADAVSLRRVGWASSRRRYCRCGWSRGG
jgi:hypothetical protein